MKRKVLLLFAHPSQHRSEVNVPLFNMAKKIDNITGVDLYYEYPTYHIDIDREQKRLKENNVIIFQFPLFWYSTPSILKEWQDLVLEYGFAYGSKGKALNGKYFMCVLTAGGREDAYKTDGFNHFTLRELLQPLEQMAYITGMKYLAPYVLYGTRTAIEEGKIGSHINGYRTLLLSLIYDRVDLPRLAQAQSITAANLSTIMKAYDQ